MSRPVCLQCRCVGVSVVHQYERHRDVRRQRHVVVDGHLPQLMCRRRAIFSVRRAELFHVVRVVDLRRLPTQPCQGQSSPSALQHRVWQVPRHRVREIYDLAPVHAISRQRSVCFRVYTVSQKKGPTLKRYSSKLYGSILMIFGRNIQKSLE